MISVLKRGEYKILEAKNNIRILILDNKEVFEWNSQAKNGEISISSYKNNQDDNLLSVGNYRLYNVEDETDYIGQKHLELQVGCGYWQGYLLPKDLPKKNKESNVIIPTKELLTKTNNCCHHSSNSL